MSEPNAEDLLLEYLRGSPPPERARELRLALEKLGYGERELDELRAVYCGIDRVVDATPSPALTTNFYAMLAAEKRKAAEGRGAAEDRAAADRRGAEIGRGPARALVDRLRGMKAAHILPRLAYAALLLVVGWAASFWIGPERGGAREVEYLTSEVTQMKKLVMFSMLNRESATERLQAVEYLRDIAGGDDQALAALVETLDRDASVNVRLAALDALSELAEAPPVRDRLVATIDRQDAPLVLLQLVDLMVSLDEQRAVGPFKQVLARPDLNVTVRGRMAEGLRYLM